MVKECGFYFFARTSLTTSKTSLCIAAAAATTPLDVAKTLLQTRGEATDVRIRNCNGLVDAFKLIYQRQGLAGFGKGLQPRVLSHMPSTAICWGVYEYGKWFLSRDNADQQPINLP